MSTNPYKDLMVDEEDGKPRYNLVDREGNVVARDVALEISSEIIQEGDQYGAAEMNTFITRDEDGILTSNFLMKEEY